MIIHLLLLFLWLALPVRPIQFNSSIWGRKPSVKATTNNIAGDLFAVIGTGGCAESLYYGPKGIDITGSSDGIYRTYFSANVPTKDVPTTRWLQIVTMDGAKELFRIYWTFTGAKTYTQRIVDAVSTGEPVSYLVIDRGTGLQFRYNGIWRFSSQSGITTQTFAVTKSVCCFSRADGAWGAGSGVIDGNIPSSGQNFWGLANYRGPDSYNCDIVYAQGRGYAFDDGRPITYMYQLLGDGPTKAPTVIPTARPTLPVPTPLPTIPPPSAAPTLVPTSHPTYPAPTPVPSYSAQPTMAGQQLFATIGGDSCAAALYYGPQAVTSQGSADGQHASFVSTSITYRNIPHTEWLQIVTADGTTELFRIFWTFSVPRTLEGHFAAAATTDGAAVAYRVVRRNGAVTEGLFVWRFTASTGFDALAVFDAASSSCCFSVTALWGVGTALAQDGVTTVPAWGQANPGGSDADTCYKVYMDGAAVQGPTPAADPGQGGRSYFYYSPDMSLLEPIGGPRYAVVEFTVTMVINGIYLQQYQRATDAYDNLFKKALSRSMSGVAEWNVRVLKVSAFISSARYAYALLQSLVSGQAGSQAANTNDLQVWCSVRVEESPLSYAQYAYALQMAVAGGVFDQYLHEFALYLRLNDASDASAVTVSTEQHRGDDDGGSNNRGSGISGLSSTVIIVIVVFVVGTGAVWYYYESASYKRIGRVDVGSVHSQDEEAAGTESSPVMVFPAGGWGGSGGRGVRPDSVSVELSEVGPSGRVPSRRSSEWRRAGRRIQERHSVPRTSGSRGSSGAVQGDDESSGSDEGEGVSALPIRRVASRQGGSSAETSIVPSVVARPTRVQPRGAVAVPFALVRSSSARSDSHVVQVTPRSVQVAQTHSTPRRPSLTPIASAQLVQDGPDPASSVTGVGAPVTVVAVPLNIPAAGRLVVAQASPAGRR